MHMDKIKNINAAAYNYLQAIPVEHWSRHGFSTASKSGMLLNNCCESFNNVLREARTKPILQLMEWIRRYIMARCVAKREGLKKFNGVIMPSVVRMIEKRLQQTSQMRLRQADLNEFEVDHEDFTYVEDLEAHTCSCGRWTLMGIPCWHALACIQLRRLKYEQFVHKEYHVDTYASTYAPKLRAMPGQQQWEQTDYPKPLPSPHRNLPGRPSNHKRKKEVGEVQERQEEKKAKRQNRCLRCGDLGHYQKKCNKPIALGFVKTKGGKSSTATTKSGGPSKKKSARKNRKQGVDASKKSAAAKKGPTTKQSTGKGPLVSSQYVQASQMSTSTSAPQIEPLSQP